MKKVIILVCTVIFLIGCATTAKYEALLATWVGSSERSLVQSWGPPKQVYDAGDGARYLIYTHSRKIHIPATEPTYTTTMIGNTVYEHKERGSAAYNIRRYCKTSFEVINGVVTSWHLKGDDCLSR